MRGRRAFGLVHFALFCMFKSETKPEPFHLECANFLDFSENSVILDGQCCHIQVFCFITKQMENWEEFYCTLVHKDCFKSCVL